MLTNPSITVVILTHNEEFHIARCVKSLLPIASRIVVVDSFSTDQTTAIAASLGAEIYQRKWLNYSDQFQWALDNCGIRTSWVMRMDADEYVEHDLQLEIQTIVPNAPESIGGLYMNRKHFFYGKWVRFGGRYPLTLLRIWRNGMGRIENRWMDEHIILEGRVGTMLLKGGLVDDNLKGIHFLISKHNDYATREAIDILNDQYHFFPVDRTLENSDVSRVKVIRFLKKNVYQRLPLALRSIAYFLYRFILQLGFLDGGRGFVYHFMQGFWYRMLVDAKIHEVLMETGGDPVRIKSYFKERYGVVI